MEIAGKTDVGCVRANNEDNFATTRATGSLLFATAWADKPPVKSPAKWEWIFFWIIFVKAQNSSGPAGGSSTEGASASANCLANAIHLATAAFIRPASRKTAAAAWAPPLWRRWCAAMPRYRHVGDSRIYLMRQGAIQQLTQDHSLVMEQVRRGYITLEQAQQSDMQNIILRALGSEEAVEPDIEDLVAVPGDVLLMTSDGLTRHVRDEEILQIVTGAADLNQACNALVQAAKRPRWRRQHHLPAGQIVERSWYQNIFSKLFFGGPQWQNSI